MSVSGKMPLNGSKTHPLKTASIEGLKRLTLGPLRGWELNPGVRDRLCRGDVERGPYARQDEYGDWRITDAGREALVEVGRDE